jgi:transcriptional regulator
MYLPSHFEEKRPEVLADLVRAHPLGMLITQDATHALAANTIPFLLDTDPAGGPGILRAHVARANPLWREATAEFDSVVAFQGEQAYISPSFYPSKAEHGKVVPTWNYVMVQARGKLRAIDDAAWVRTLVTRLTERQETPRAQPWEVSDAPDDFVATMLRAIVGIEIVLTSITGKWKVSQNRSSADRRGVARGLADAGIRFEASSTALPPLAST